MAADYDEPRKEIAEQSEESLEELKASTRDEAKSSKIDEDEAEAADSFELPGADLSHVELTVEVVPEQQGEFTCTRCFLVRHHSQLADGKAMICAECAAA